MSDLGLGEGVNESVRRARLEFARRRSMPVTGKPIPFGCWHCEWREMVGSMQAGDELWEYRSSEHSWKHLGGATDTPQLVGLLPPQRHPKAIPGRMKKEECRRKNGGQRGSNSHYDGGSRAGTGR